MVRKLLGLIALGLIVLGQSRIDPLWALARGQPIGWAGRLAQMFLPTVQIDHRS